MHPIECSNYTEVSSKIAKCSALEELGVQFIPSQKRSGSPCKRCKQEWVENKVPTKDSVTPTMNAILKANGKIPLPTVAEQVKDYSSALLNWVFDGFANMPEPYYQERVAQCLLNECGLYDKALDSCLGCGCKIQDTALKSGKARYPLSECPADMPVWKKSPGIEYLHRANPNQNCQSCGKR